MKRYMKLKCLSAVLSVAALPCVAMDSISLGEAADYNALIFGDFSSPYYSSTTGSVAIGGNLLLNNYGLATDLNTNEQFMSVIVGGDFSLDNGKIYAGHSVVAGSAAGVTYQVRNALNSNQALIDQVTSPVDFNALQASLIAKSLAYAEYPSNGNVINNYGGLTLQGDCEAELQVFAIDAAELMGANTLNVSCIPDEAGVLINVSGDSPGNTGLSYFSLETLKPYRERVLFNFYQATTLEIKAVGVHGSVLAPKAEILNPTGDLHGTVVAKSWNGPMHLDYVRFKGVNAALRECEGPLDSSQ